MFWRPDYPRLNDCMVTKQTFCIVLLRLYFQSNSIVLSTTVGFSNEDNCCQLQGIGKMIKEKLLKVFSKVTNLLISLEIQIRQIYC